MEALGQEELRRCIYEYTSRVSKPADDNVELAFENIDCNAISLFLQLVDNLGENRGNVFKNIVLLFQLS